jgi:hypothetical protein
LLAQHAVSLPESVAYFKLVVCALPHAQTENLLRLRQSKEKEFPVIDFDNSRDINR